MLESAPDHLLASILGDTESLVMIQRRPGAHRITVATDKGYDTRGALIDGAAAPGRVSSDVRRRVHRSETGHKVSR